MTEPQSTEAVSGESMREMQTRKQTDPSGQIGIEVGSFIMAFTVHDFFSFSLLPYRMLSAPSVFGSWHRFITVIS